MKRILVIEDDYAIREATKELLTDNGYEVIEASNGQEGIDYLKKGLVPDLILLDLMMPIKDGFQFRVEQESDPRLCKIPVIIMSADGHLDSKIQKTRATDHINKPIDIHVMLDKIKLHCS